MKSNSHIVAQYLGLTEYDKALGLMNELRGRLLADSIPDHILFLEHPPVITMGKQKSSHELKLSTEEIKKRGIIFVKTDRGGRLTYHGPGQLVIYFVCRYKGRARSIQDWIWKIEEGIRLLLDQYKIQANRDSRNPGLWVGNNKIASLGFHIQKGITTHGVSLNVSGDLEPFSYMIPCGVKGTGATSIEAQSGLAPKIEEVSKKLVSCYSEVFKCKVKLYTTVALDVVET